MCFKELTSYFIQDSTLKIGNAFLTTLNIWKKYWVDLFLIY